MNVFKNTTYQMVTRILSSVVGFIITLILARYLGANGFGDFTKVITYIGFFYLLADFGLNAIFLKQEGNDNFASLFYLRLFLAFSLFLLANFIPVFPSLRLGIFLFSFSIFAQSIIFSSTALFQKNLRYNNLFFSQLGGSILTIFLISFFVYFNYQTNYMFLALALGGLATAFLALFKSGGKIFPLSIDFSFSRSLIKESWPLALMLFFNLIYFRMDILLLSFLRPTIEVGIYGFAYKFFDVLIAFPLFLANSIYPLILKQENFSFKKTINKYLKISLLSSLILVTFFWFASPLFSLVRQEYTLSVFPFRILILSLPIFFATAILQWALIARNKQKFLMMVYLLSALANITLNIIFIPFYGYIASSFITGISEGIVLVFLTKKYISLTENFTK